METKPAVRCHHIHTSGVQCGSPAVANMRFCYYHLQGRSTAIKYYSEAPFAAIEEDLPLFEDAHSIQIAIRQIASLLLQGKIEHKTAGLLLYSLQLASCNLKRMQAEKPQPAQVVVNIENVEETLPESAFTENASPENASEPPRKQAKSAPNKKDKEQSEEEIQEQLDYLLFIGRHLDDPADSVPDEESYLRLKKALREKAPAESKNSIPPPTIQACAAQRQRSGRRHLN